VSQLPAFTIVMGGDTALVADAARDVINELAGGHDHGLVVEEIGSEELDASMVVDACLTPPFLGDRRVVVARDFGRLDADGVARILEYVSAPLDTTALVLVQGDEKVSQKVVNAAKKSGRIVGTTDTSKQDERRAFVDDHLKKSKVRFEPPARALLADHLGEDVSRLGSLLEVIEASLGEGSTVSAEDLTPFLGEAGGVAPWVLTDAIDSGDYEAALSVLHRLLHGGARHPLALMAILQGHYATMLRLDGSAARSKQQAAEVLGIHPFRAGKALSQSQRLGSAAIQDAVILLADADFGLRGGSDLPDDTLLEVLVARLCRLSPRR
jgi:DNA polymerase-3 subunit delta